MSRLEPAERSCGAAARWADMDCGCAAFAPRLRSRSEPQRPAAAVAAAAAAEEEEEEKVEEVPRLSVSLEPHTLHLASPHRDRLPSVRINHVRKTM